MNRRNFLKYATTTGMAAYATTFPGLSRALNHPGQFFLMIDAVGGWDPTSFCDPKGNIERADGRGLINRYYSSDISSVSNSPIRFAPFPAADLIAQANAPALSADLPVNNFADFFQRHAPRMLVINGIDVETVNHASGARITWSGADKEGTAGFAALAAATLAPDKLMAFISNGGYDSTGNLVPLTRINNIFAFQELAHPDLPNIYEPDHYFLKPDIYQKLELAKKQRLLRQLNTTSLPQRRAALERLLTVRSDGLDAVIAELDKIKSNLPGQTLSQGLKGKAELAIAAFTAGTAVSAHLAYHGFDTHGTHDRDQTSALANLTDAINHIWNLLELMNIADKTTMIIGSELGRTPFYNKDQGKDHWNVTSMILMGAGIRGNRVVGATTNEFAALKLDPTTLQIATDQNDPNAIKLTPAHIHAALRQHFNINAQSFPLTAPVLPLFT